MTPSSTATLASDRAPRVPPALVLQGVTHRFGALRAVDNVSLQVQVGERRALIGPNGAGKTTLFHVISGFLKPTSGRIELFGHDVTDLPTHRRVALGMVRTFQLTTLFTHLTVEQNVALAVQGHRPEKLSILRPRTSFGGLNVEVERVLGDWDLAERRCMVVSALSYGEQRRLEVILAVAQGPRLLLLDEPTAGLSPAETAATAAMIKALPREIGVVVIEHDLDVVFDLCESLTVLHLGKVVVTGSPDVVRDNAQVQEMYLGGGSE
jgi:branched-chain amino acid transport system ATP-binding protein